MACVHESDAPTVALPRLGEQRTEHFRFRGLAAWLAEPQTEALPDRAEAAYRRAHEWLAAERPTGDGPSQRLPIVTVYLTGGLGAGDADADARVAANDRGEIR